MHPHRPTGRHRLALGAMVLVGLLVLAGCPNDGPDDTARDAEVYRVVIADLISDREPDPPATDEKPILFVESFTSEGVPLGVQVELVSVFDEDYEVRFVDAREEAVEDDLEDRPVRVGGALIGLGAIVEDDLLSLRVELYENERSVVAFRYRLRNGSDGAWQILGTAEEVAPEGFVAAS